MTRLADLLQPLFEEIPMDSTIRIPLGAPPAYSRVVLDRAAGQCECAGQCGIAHARSDNRCPRRHGGWHKRHETVLVLAPRQPLTPLTVAVTLPDAELMAWCEECQAKAKKLAASP